MGNAVGNFIEPILNVIPTPRTDNLDGMIASYAKVLDEFSDEALELAAETIIRTMKTRSMPMPADCIEACRDATQALELRKRREQTKRKPIPPQVMWTEADAKRADELFASHWGERAVKDGIEIALWDFLVQQKRWPNNNEYDAVKKKSLTLQAETRDFIKISKENGGLTRQANGWVRSLNQKSDRLKKMVSVG